MNAPGARIVYFGTPQVAVAPLRALHRSGHETVLVVTRPPSRRGRRESPTPSPVARAAADMGLAVTWDLADALAAEADLGVVVAYGEFIDDDVRERRRTVNLHFSLLPRWRGAAPVERAILAGDSHAGVCLIEVAREFDTGGVYKRASTPIGRRETAEQLRARLCELGIGLLLEALADGFGPAESQSGAVTWAEKLTVSELRISWDGPAEHVLRLVRVGGAWTTFRGSRLKILEARAGGDASAGGSPAAPGTIAARRGAGGVEAVLVATTDTPIELVAVQAEGRRATTAAAWCRGVRIAAGERLGK